MERINVKNQKPILKPRNQRTLHEATIIQPSPQEYASGFECYNTTRFRNGVTTI